MVKCVKVSTAEKELFIALQLGRDPCAPNQCFDKDGFPIKKKKKKKMVFLLGVSLQLQFWELPRFWQEIRSLIP